MLLASCREFEAKLRDETMPDSTSVVYQENLLETLQDLRRQLGEARDQMEDLENENSMSATTS